jgi:von Willebrand factor type D domain
VSGIAKDAVNVKIKNSANLVKFKVLFLDTVNGAVYVIESVRQFNESMKGRKPGPFDSFELKGIQNIYASSFNLVTKLAASLDLLPTPSIRDTFLKSVSENLAARIASTNIYFKAADKVVDIATLAVGLEYLIGELNGVFSKAVVQNDEPILDSSIASNTEQSLTIPTNSDVKTTVRFKNKGCGKLVLVPQQNPTSAHGITITGSPGTVEVEPKGDQLVELTVGCGSFESDDTLTMAYAVNNKMFKKRNTGPGKTFGQFWLPFKVKCVDESDAYFFAGAAVTKADQSVGKAVDNPVCPSKYSVGLQGVFKPNDGEKVLNITGDGLLAGGSYSGNQITKTVKLDVGHYSAGIHVTTDKRPQSFDKSWSFQVEKNDKNCKDPIISGDPHITTPDGFQYDSHAFGEFTYLRPVNPADPNAITLMGRQQPTGAAAILTATALKVNGHTITFQKGKTPMLSLDGEAITATNGAFYADLGNNSSLTANLSGRAKIDVRFPDGELSVINTAGNQTVALSIAKDGRHVGMLGTPNGDPNDDYRLPDGSTPNDSLRYSFKLADGWRVNSKAESIFTYGPGEGPETYNKANTLNLPSLEEIAAKRVDVAGLFANACANTTPAPAQLTDDLALDLLVGLPADSISDQLCSYEVRGKVNNRTTPGLTIGGARVRITSPALSPCETLTSADGSYFCRMLPKANGGVPTATVEVDGASPVTVAFERQANRGETLSVSKDIDAALTTLRLMGTITDANGGPTTANSALLFVPELNVKRQLALNAQGKYDVLMAFPRVDATDFFMTLSAEGADSKGVRTFGSRLVLDGLKTQTENLQLSRTVTVNGTLNTLVAGFPVNLTSTAIMSTSDGRELCKLDFSSTFTCAVPLTSSIPFDAVVKVDGFWNVGEPLEQNIRIDPSVETTEVTINGTPRLAVLKLSGFVTDSVGNGVSGVSIFTEPNTTMQALTGNVRTDGSGQYQLTFVLNRANLSGVVNLTAVSGAMTARGQIAYANAVANQTNTINIATALQLNRSIRFAADVISQAFEPIQLIYARGETPDTYSGRGIDLVFPDRNLKFIPIESCSGGAANLGGGVSVTSGGTGGGTTTTTTTIQCSTSYSVYEGDGPPKLLSAAEFKDWFEKQTAVKRYQSALQLGGKLTIARGSTKLCEGSGQFGTIQCDAVLNTAESFDATFTISGDWGSVSTTKTVPAGGSSLYVDANLTADVALVKFSGRLTDPNGPDGDFRIGESTLEKQFSEQSLVFNKFRDTATDGTYGPLVLALKSGLSTTTGTLAAEIKDQHTRPETSFSLSNLQSGTITPVSLDFNAVNRPIAVIRGKVVNAKGVPITGASVSASHLGGQMIRSSIGLTNASGEYAINATLEYGAATGQLQVLTTGHMARFDYSGVLDGAITDVRAPDLKFERIVNFSGTVRNLTAPGLPLNNERVAVRLEDGTVLCTTYLSNASTATEWIGKYKCSASLLVTNAFNVTIDEFGPWGSTQATVAVPEATDSLVPNEVSHNFAIAPTLLRLSGVVKDAAGNPSANATVTWSGTGLTSGSLKTDVRGSYLQYLTVLNTQTTLNLAINAKDPANNRAAKDLSIPVTANALAEQAVDFTLENRSVGVARWVINRPGSVTVTPSGTVLVAGTQLAAFDSNGAPRWLTNTGGVRGPAVVANDGTIYVSGTGSTGAPRVFAVNPDGTIKWEFATGGTTGTPSLTADGSIIVTVAGTSSRLLSLSPSGGQRWSTPISNLNGNVQPAIDSSGLTIITNDLKVLRLKLDGSIAWTKVLPGSSNPEWIVALADGQLLTMQNRQVLSFAPTGQLLWTLNLEGVPSTPVIDANGKLLFGMNTGRLAVVSSDGLLERQVTLAGALGTPMVADDGLYVPSANNRVYTLNATGATAWEFNAEAPVTDLAFGTDGSVLAMSGSQSKVFAINSSSGGLGATQRAQKNAVGRGNFITLDGVERRVLEVNGTITGLPGAFLKDQQVQLLDSSGKSLCVTTTDVTAQFTCVARTMELGGFNATLKVQGAFGSSSIPVIVAAGTNESVITITQDVSNLIVSVKLTGTIKNGLDQPLADAILSIAADPSLTVLNQDGTPITGDANGIRSIPTGSTGEYAFYAVYPGGTTTTNLELTASHPTGFTATQAIREAITAPQADRLQDLKVPVTTLSYSGVVKNRDGQTLEGVKVSVFVLATRDPVGSSSLTYDSAYEAIVTTDANGQFTTPVGLIKKGFRDFQTQFYIERNGVSNNIASTATSLVEAQVNTVTKPLTFALASLQLSGTVKDGTGTVLANSSVKITGAFNKDLITDTDGKYATQVWFDGDKAFNFNLEVNSISTIQTRNVQLTVPTPGNVQRVEDFVMVQHQPGTAAWTHSDTGSHTSASITSGGMIVYRSASKVIAVQPDGTQVWSKAVQGDLLQPMIGNQDAIYTNDDAAVLAISTDGSQKWRTVLPGNQSVTSMALAGNGNLYASNGIDLFGLSPDGSILFQSQPRADAREYTKKKLVVAPDGTVYTTSIRRQTYNYYSNFYFLNIDGYNPDGSARSSTEVASEYGVSSLQVRQLLVGSNGWVYAIHSNVIRAIKPDGTQAWATSMQIADSYSALAVLGENNQIFVLGPGSSNIAVFDATTGVSTSQIQLPHATTWITLGKDNTLLLTGSGVITTLDAAGATSWTYSIPSTNSNAPSSIHPNGTVLASTTNGLTAVYAGALTQLANTAWPTFAHDAQGSNRATSSTTPSRLVRFKGTVVSQFATSLAVPGTQVSVTGPDGELICETLSETNGTYSCTAPVTTMNAFTAKLSVPTGNEPYTADVTVPATTGATTEVSAAFELPITTLRVSGVVKGYSGQPLANANIVEYNGPYSNAIVRFQTDSTGHYDGYILEGWSQYSDTLSFQTYDPSSGKYLNVNRNVALTPGGLTSVTVDMLPVRSVTIQGTIQNYSGNGTTLVVDSNGKTVCESYFYYGNLYCSWETTNTDAFAVNLSVQLNGNGSLSSVIDIPASANYADVEVTKNFEVGATSFTVQGRIVGAQGQPLTNATVVGSTDAKQLFNTTTDANGEYQVTLSESAVTVTMRIEATSPSGRVVQRQVLIDQALDQTGLILNANFNLDPNRAGGMRWGLNGTFQHVAAGANGLTFVTEVEPDGIHLNAFNSDGVLMWSTLLPNVSETSSIMVGPNNQLVVSTALNDSSTVMFGLNASGAIQYQLANTNGNTFAIGPDGHLIVQTAQGLSAYDLSGGELWTRDIQDTLDVKVNQDGVIYVLGSNWLLGLDGSGQTMWSTTENVNGSKLVVGPDGMVLVDTQFSGFSAFSATGTYLWFSPVPPRSVIGSPVVGANGNIYYSVRQYLSVLDGSGQGINGPDLANISNDPHASTNGTVAFTTTDCQAFTGCPSGLFGIVFPNGQVGMGGLENFETANDFIVGDGMILVRTSEGLIAMNLP